MTLTRAATLDDLARYDGKAELIGGRIIPLMATGHWPGRIAFLIARRLDDHATACGIGCVYGDNVGFAVPGLRSGRESFSPDAAYVQDPPPWKSMGFVNRPPTFAVEVRSENDYGEAAERAMEAKRDDYFEAGTLVVWDVDPIDECVHVYRREAPDNHVTYHHGEAAEAEPAAPGWTLPVDDIFR